MPLILYTSKNFSRGSSLVIEQANEILDEYAEQGFDLTLRQLYYQFVSRDLIRNTDRDYKRIGSIVNDARMAGMIDWDRIVDRTRSLKPVPSWSSPMAVIRQVAKQYREPVWTDQPTRIEVWIEKDALVGVIEGVCRDLDVPYLSCRGYTSQSAMWLAAQRLGGYMADGQAVRILHLGDHDPSGIDMSRDIEDRLRLFLRTDLALARIEEAGFGHEDDEYKGVVREAVRDADDLFQVDRIALTMDQIDQYNPPPNPAKLTDSRGSSYVETYGSQSWELDALTPTVMAALIRGEVEALIDHEKMDAAIAVEKINRETLEKTATRWHSVAEFLTTESEED